jgi:hypothetical protein
MVFGCGSNSIVHSVQVPPRPLPKVFDLISAQGPLEGGVADGRWGLSRSGSSLGPYYGRGCSAPHPSVGTLATRSEPPAACPFTPSSARGGATEMRFGDLLTWAVSVYDSARRNDASSSGPLNGFCRTAATFADNRGSTA